MHFNLNKPPLVVIIGPTAVGKTEVSLQLAERLNGEIVSGDYCGRSNRASGIEDYQILGKALSTGR